MLKIKPIVLALLGIMGTSAYAATDSSAQLQQQIDQIIAKQQQLQTQVATLTQQLKAEKAAKASQAQPAQNDFNKPTEEAVHAYSFVRLGSYLGEEYSYDGSELVINVPSVLADETLLKYRRSENLAAKKQGYPAPETPYMILSGELEGQATFDKPVGGQYTSDADLTDAELAMQLVMSKWVNGLFTLAYDNNVDNYSTGYNRVGQSRIYVNKAFITLGNLMYSPVYGSVGQMYVPFGRYSYTTVSTPLTEDLARTKARAVSVGYYQNQANGFAAHAYVFQATAGTANQKDKLANFGVDSSYHFGVGSDVNGDAGLGYINNIADSQGMLNNGVYCSDTTDCPFRGYGWDDHTLAKSVGGYDAHAKVSYNQFAAITEYITASRQFNSSDLTFNSAGAKPSAFDLQGIYSFMAGNLPSSWVLDYGFTRQALALQLPKTRYGTTVNFDVWRDTIFSLQYQHSIYYPTSNTGGGEAITPVAGSGLSDNAVIAQLDMYF